MESRKMKMKFVTFLDYHGEQIIVFPDHIQHLQFSRAVNQASYSEMEPIAGGFVVDGECVGESISLGLASRTEDTELLKSLQGSQPIPSYHKMPVIETKETKPSNLTRNQRKRQRKKRA